MEKVKKHKEKRAYSVFSNIPYAIMSLWQEQKSIILLVILGTAMRIAVPFTGILTPRIVIDEITSGSTPARFLTVMGTLAVVLMVIHFIRGWTNRVIDRDVFTISDNIFTRNQAEKILTMDAENMAKGQFVRCASRTTMHYDEKSSNFFVRILSNIAVNIGGLILFGGMIVFIHPLILLLLIVGAVVNGLMLNWLRTYDRKRWDVFGLWKTNMLLGYISRIYGEKRNAKDVRLYDMIPWFDKRFDYNLNEMNRSNAKLSFRQMISELTDGLIVLLRDGIAYAFLVYLLLENHIGLGEFVMTFAAIGGLAGWINGIVSEANTLLTSSLELSIRREMLNFADVSNPKPSIPIPQMNEAPEIVLENVSYTYPKFVMGAEGRITIYDRPPTIENINVTIKPGERIAIVGVNGAGKTTLIKIICGLIKPTTGRAMLAGRDICEYDRDEYFKLITAVFQDIYLLAESITENVSHSTHHKMDETDKKRAATCLEQAGLADKINSLPKGVDTLLVREVHENAIELSGGEKQKLALARALYKNSPVIILDEPTASLDAIAEDEIYQQYAAMTKGKTSIYISHRLASTRFCDRILFMNDKTITEEGSHDELMNLDGKYAEMYSIQASYYTNKGGVLNE